MNELLFFVTFIVTLMISLFAFRLGRNYVFAFIGTMGTLTFFLASLVTTLFGFAFLIGEIFYAALFFTTDMISEHYGRREAHNLIWLVVIVGVTIGVLVSLATYLVPHPADFIQPHIIAIMQVAPRILIAGLIMFIIEQHLDIWIFHKIREKTKGGKLWVRNIFSTSATQLIDVLIFYPIAFYGLYGNLIQLMIAAFAFKLVMALLDTPFIYLSYKFRPKELLE